MPRTVSLPRPVWEGIADLSRKHGKVATAELLGMARETLRRIVRTGAASPAYNALLTSRLAALTKMVTPLPPERASGPAAS